MKAYNVYIHGMKVGNVFEWNIFEAVDAANLFGIFVEVVEAR
jgi:hypothetical protein